jgi:tetratricopeptide (TPR) repeat protein
MAPVYLPQFADLAKLLGQMQTALNAYADYLEKNPDDPVVLLKVGKLYKEIDQQQSAITVFEYLLERDPGNKDVRQLLEELTT